MPDVLLSAVIDQLACESAAVVVTYVQYIWGSCVAPHNALVSMRHKRQHCQTYALDDTNLAPDRDVSLLLHTALSAAPLCGLPTLLRHCVS